MKKVFLILGLIFSLRLLSKSDYIDVEVKIPDKCECDSGYYYNKGNGRCEDPSGRSQHFPSNSCECLEGYTSGTLQYGGKRNPTRCLRCPDGYDLVHFAIKGQGGYIPTNQYISKCLKKGSDKKDLYEQAASTHNFTTVQ